MSHETVWISKFLLPGSNFSCIFNAIVRFSKGFFVIIYRLLSFKIHLLIFLHFVFGSPFSTMTSMIFHGIQSIFYTFYETAFVFFRFLFVYLCVTKAFQKNKTKAIANPSEANPHRLCSRCMRSQLETVTTIWTLNNVNNVHYSLFKLVKVVFGYIYIYIYRFKHTLALSLVEIKLNRHQSNGLSTKRKTTSMKMNLISGHLIPRSLYFVLVAVSVFSCMSTIRHSSCFVRLRFIFARLLKRNKQHLN